MTFIYELDIDIMEIYLYAKKRSSDPKVFKSYSLKLEIDLDLEIELDLNPRNLIYELDLDILKIYLYTKN